MNTTWFQVGSNLEGQLPYTLNKRDLEKEICVCVFEREGESVCVCWGGRGTVSLLRMKEMSKQSYTRGRQADDNTVLPPALGNLLNRKG